MQNSDNFYSQIEANQNFSQITSLQNFSVVPEDWMIIITDVVMSTQAIENGKYKDVNAVGATVISAILNLEKDLEIPFIFGGDGATLLVPNRLKSRVVEALQGVQNIAKSLDLDLRASIVPVAEIYAQNEKLLINKYRITPRYSQAVFYGHGFDIAEKMIKNPITRDLWEVKNNPDSVADTTGFTCRWQPVISQHGQTISLIVKVLAIEDFYLYQEIYEEITKIYGDIQNHHPISFKSLRLSTDKDQINTQAKIDSKTSKIRILLENIYGTIFNRSREGSLTDKKDNIIANTDYKKIDGSLKMVFAGKPSKLVELREFLDNLHSQDKIFYGLHTSDSALLTCLVFAESDKEVHFVDGGDGGYAMAAKQIKKLLKNKV